MIPASLPHFLLSFKTLQGNTLEQVLTAFDDIVIEKGECILKEKKISDTYIFLERGFMRSFVYDTEGNEVTTQLYSPGQIVMEPASFFMRIPSEENIQAITDTAGKSLSFEKMNHLFHSSPEFREMGRSILVKNLVGYKLRNISLINKTAEERYLMLIQQQPEILQNIPLKYIASYLGITDTSLSRIRKEIGNK